MKKRQCITVSFAILLAAAATFSFPIQKKHGFPFPMLPHAAITAQTPKSAGGEVTHLVLDSAVDEVEGSVSVFKAFYDEKGRLDSTVREEENHPYWRSTYYHATNGGIDSMLNQSWKDGDWIYETKWFFAAPLDVNIFPDMYDRIAEGEGIGANPFPYSLELSLSSAFGMAWDSITRRWYNYEKDTLIDGNNGTKIYLAYNWDSLSNSWLLGTRDSFFFSEGYISQIILNFCIDTIWFRNKYSFIYNNNGRVIEASDETWLQGAQTWELHTRQKYHITINSHSHIDTFRVQYWDSFTESWTSLDSGSYALYSYTYDPSGNITTRSDSTLDRSWNGDTNPSKTTHYFKYQTFSSPVIPRKAIKPRPNSVVSASSDGKIRFLSNNTENLSATLYTLSGRSICRISLHSDLCLNDYCAQNGIHPGNGIFLLLIKSDKTGQPFGEWKVFFR
jgi:hypothetical protein